MSFSMNKVILFGTLGKDAETRITQNNNSATQFSLATERSWKDKTEQWQKETTWHNIVVWNLSEYFKNGLKKGKKFLVTGRITKRDYTNKEGQKIYITEVIAEEIIPAEKIESSGESYAGSGTVGNYNDAPTPSSSEDDLPF